MWNAERHCFDDDSDSDLDWHQNGNSDLNPDLDPDHHQSDADPKHWLWLSREESLWDPGPGFEPGDAFQQPGALTTYQRRTLLLHYYCHAMVDTGREI